MFLLVKEEQTVGFVREIIFRIGSEQIEVVQVETQLDDITALAFLQEIPQQNSKEFRLKQNVIDLLVGTNFCSSIERIPLLRRDRCDVYVACLEADRRPLWSRRVARAGKSTGYQTGTRHHLG